MPGGHPARVPGGHPARVLGGHLARAPGGHPAVVPGGHPARVPGGHTARVPGGHPARVPGGHPAGVPLSGAHLIPTKDLMTHLDRAESLSERMGGNRVALYVCLLPELNQFWHKTRSGLLCYPGAGRRWLCGFSPR